MCDYSSPPIGNNEVGGTARPRQGLLFVLVQRLPVPLLPESTRHITGRPEYWSQEPGPTILTRRMVRKTSNRYSSREVGAVEAEKVDCSAFDRNPQSGHVVSCNVLWSDE